MAQTTHSTDLLDFLHGIDGSALPGDVRAKARQCLLDALGCGLFGTLQPWSRILSDEMIAEAGKGAASLIGHPRLLPAPAAALCNGLAVHGYELDDLIAASITHPAAAVVPATLAAAEVNGASGARVGTAIVAGYEIMHRVALAMGTAPANAGFHVTSLVAPLGAAVAAGTVMRLTRPQLGSAVGLACSAAGGIKNFATGDGGGMVKRLHLGRAAEAGVRAAQLAARGFSGPPYAVDGDMGMLDIYGRETADAARLTEGLGSDWAIRDTWFKIYPVCGWIQSVVQILTELRGAGPVQPAQVAEIRIGVSAYAARNNGDRAPKDTMGAQYSIPFCAALALIGDPRDPDEYGTARLSDPEIRRLAEMVDIHVDPEAEAAYPAKFAGRVALTFADGRRAEMAVPECRGTPADPCSNAELEAKFFVLAGKVLTPAAAQRLAEAVARLDTLPDMTALAALLRTELPLSAVGTQ